MPNSSAAAEAAIDALVALLAERRWSEVSLGDIAQCAGIDLGALRGAFPSKGAILAGFIKRLDQEVLAGAGAADEAFMEPPRERLFDIVMRRLDALAPHKALVRNVREALRRDPMFAMAWNRAEVNAAQWMLAAAGIEEGGPFGGIRAQGLALLFARVLEVWLEDDDPALARTMAALDRRLRRAERLADLGRVAERVGAPLSKGLHRPHLRRRFFHRRDGRRDRYGHDDDRYGDVERPGDDGEAPAAAI
jgi:AcrR family transcriptional regulator